MHLKVANVVQLLRKFISDNPSQLLQPTASKTNPLNADESDTMLLHMSRKLNWNALLEQVSNLEKAALKTLGFNLNVPTPAEFIVVYLQLFE